MKDYYQILGVKRDAAADDIKRAYRRLASQHHPDKGGDKARFQEIQEAYNVLSDQEQRQQYDNPGMRQFHSAFSGQPNFNLNDIFSMFGTRFHNDPELERRRGIRLALWITLQDVDSGGPRIIAINTGRGADQVEITIPQGIEDGDSVRYSRIGPGGSDVVVQFRVQPDATWTRHGSNLSLTIQVPIWDLITGCKPAVTTLSGRTVEITVPAMSQPGTVLRVRGHGLPVKASSTRGDLMVKLQARLPDRISGELLDLIERERGQ